MGLAVLTAGSAGVKGSLILLTADLLMLPMLSMLPVLLWCEDAPRGGLPRRLRRGVICLLWFAAVLEAASDMASPMLPKLSALLSVPVTDGHSLLPQMLPPLSWRRH